MMLDNVSVILHWNTDYAEIPRKELPVVVEKSYKPMVEAIENWRDGTICFNITGHTTEYLLQNYPELVDQVKALAKDNTIEMLASGYSHPILPLLPRERVKQQLVDHIDQIKDVYGKKPIGIWPPELAVSPSVLQQFKEVGLEWTAIDYEHYLLSQFFGNDQNPFERRDETLTEFMADAYWTKGIKRLLTFLKAKRLMGKANQEQVHPLQRVGIKDEESIKAYLSSASWSYSTMFAVGGTVPIYTAKQHLKSILKVQTPILALYATDIEFFGYRGMGPDPPAPETLIDFLLKLQKHNISIISPTQVAEDQWPTDPSYLSTGSWAPDKSFRIWTDSEDNKELARRAEEIYQHLRMKKWAKGLMKKVEPYLRIMENSDPRGWAPLPERKHEAYSAINKIFEIIEKG
jgi:predicted glycosyl hydrolase (DUF1957 family)